MFCGNCGTAIRDGAVYCPACGWAVPGAAQAAGEPVKSEPFSYNGAVAGESAPAQTAPVPPPSLPPVTPPAPKTPEAKAEVESATCAACGKPVEADWQACPWCKAEIVRERICASCGKKLDPDWLLCPWCKTEVKA